MSSLQQLSVASKLLQDQKILKTMFSKTSSSLSCLQSNFLHIINRYKNPQPAWSVFREASFGHGELKLANSTHAYWSWHRNDDDESVRSDQVWITSLENSGCIAEKKHELMKILSGP
jgi:hypothetical protein